MKPRVIPALLLVIALAPFLLYAYYFPHKQSSLKSQEEVKRELDFLRSSQTALNNLLVDRDRTINDKERVIIEKGTKLSEQENKIKQLEGQHEQEQERIKQLEIQHEREQDRIRQLETSLHQQNQQIYQNNPNNPVYQNQQNNPNNPVYQNQQNNPQNPQNSQNPQNPQDPQIQIRQAQEDAINAAIARQANPNVMMAQDRLSRFEWNKPLPMGSLRTPPLKIPTPLEDRPQNDDKRVGPALPIDLSQSLTTDFSTLKTETLVRLDHGNTGCQEFHRWCKFRPDCDREWQPLRDRFIDPVDRYASRRATVREVLPNRSAGVLLLILGPGGNGQDYTAMTLAEHGLELGLDMEGRDGTVGWTTRCSGEASQIEYMKDTIENSGAYWLEKRSLLVLHSTRHPIASIQAFLVSLSKSSERYKQLIRWMSKFVPTCPADTLTLTDLKSTDWLPTIAVAMAQWLWMSKSLDTVADYRYKVEDSNAIEEICKLVAAAQPSYAQNLKCDGVATRYSLKDEDPMPPPVPDLDFSLPQKIIPTKAVVPSPTPGGSGGEVGSGGAPPPEPEEEIEIVRKPNVWGPGLPLTWGILEHADASLANQIWELASSYGYTRDLPTLKSLPVDPLVIAQKKKANEDFDKSIEALRIRAHRSIPGASVNPTPPSFSGQHVPEYAFDGDNDTYLWVEGVGVRLYLVVLDLTSVALAARTVTSITVLLGRQTDKGFEDLLESGTLEVQAQSVEGRILPDGCSRSRDYKPLVTFTGSSTVTAPLDWGKPMVVDCVRIRGTRPQKNWLAIREFILNK